MSRNGIADRPDLPPRLPAAPRQPLLGAGSKDPAEERGVALRERTRTKKPRLYKVVLHNDDYTTMEFVVDVLVRHFGKSREEASRVMLEVHHRGVGVAGVYTYEVAETKIVRVTSEAREHGMPLQCSMEQA